MAAAFDCRDKRVLTASFVEIGKKKGWTGSEESIKPLTSKVRLVATEQTLHCTCDIVVEIAFLERTGMSRKVGRRSITCRRARARLRGQAPPAGSVVSCRGTFWSVVSCCTNNGEIEKELRNILMEGVDHSFASPIGNGEDHNLVHPEDDVLDDSAGDLHDAESAQRYYEVRYSVT